MTESNSMDYESISLAINELNKTGKTKLSEKLNDILLKNELPKPERHNKKEDRTTSYFKVELNEEELDTVVDLFLYLEAGSISVSGETTDFTSSYSDMVDRWSSIKPRE